MTLYKRKCKISLHIMMSYYTAIKPGNKKTWQEFTHNACSFKHANTFHPTEKRGGYFIRCMVLLPTNQIGRYINYIPN